jgi:UPF0716 protein FxsA
MGLLLLGYATVELTALVALVAWLGLGWTLLVLLGGGLAGIWLVRREGMRAAIGVVDAARRGRVAHAELTDGALIGLAGVLILVPGVVSDALGLLLVLRPTRALARRALLRAAERRAPALRSERIRRGGPVVDGIVVDASVPKYPDIYRDHQKAVDNARSALAPPRGDHR